MTNEYRYPAITVDIAIFRLRGSRTDPTLEILLIERGREPFAGCWALPGGFMGEDEEIEAAADRELLEETGMQPDALMEVGVYSRPNRDPRGRTISVVFIGWEPPDCVVRAGDDAAKAQWFALDELPPLAFDHREIVEHTTDRLHCALVGYDAVSEIVPERKRRTIFKAVTSHRPRSVT